LISDESVTLSTFARLLIPRTIYAEMLSQAAAEAPLECCGLLAGPPVVASEDRKVARRYPLTNALASGTEYESDPRSMFDAMKDMRRNGWEVLAVYHSHPTSPPIPSRKDLERNYSEQVVNLIISLQQTQPEVRGWWLTAAESREAGWEITADG
jgi:[CysO sulfur-carrier protein]-S-L-cysteine hydrolase